MTPPTRKSLPMRVLKALASGLCFTLWGLGAAVLAWFVLPIAVNLRMRKASPEARIARAQEITATGNRMLMWALRVFRLVMFTPTGRELRLPEGPYVLVANHPCLIDVCALTSINPNICVIAKPKMTRSWFVGRALRAAGHIEAPGREDSVFAGASVISEAVDRLRRGIPVLFFPEGTRSPPGGIEKLSRGAFEAARQADVPIACALITVTPPTLHRGMRWYSLPKEGSEYSIESIAPITIEELGGDTKKAMRHFEKIFSAHAARMSDPATQAIAIETHLSPSPIRPEQPHES